jgi:hypothetical protein
MCVYNPNCLEWHRDDEQCCKPRRFLCGLVVRQASLLTLFNRLAVALAKSQDHRASCGVFSFGADRVTRVKLLGLHGLPSQKTPHSYTPESKRRPALIERLVKQLVHGGNKASCISESIRQAHLGLFGFSNVNRSQ